MGTLKEYKYKIRVGEISYYTNEYKNKETGAGLNSDIVGGIVFISGDIFGGARK